MNEINQDITVIRYISLVRKEGGEPIIGIPYREMSVDPDLVASFVLAVIIFENRQLKTFTKEGYVVVIEEGKHVVGLLIIDRVDDDTPYRESLIKIITQFEKDYEPQLNNWKGDIRPFREFALQILQVYPYRLLDMGFVPRLVTKSEAAPDHRAKIPWSVGTSNEKLQTILGFINGKRSMLEIMNTSGYSFTETMAIFSMLDHYNWITLSRRLDDNAILFKKMDAPRLLIGFYGDQLSRLMKLCDGKRTLAEICEGLPYNSEAVKTIIKNLLDAGVLGFQDENDIS
jgi:hypothetical protein